MKTLQKIIAAGALLLACLTPAARAQDQLGYQYLGPYNGANNLSTILLSSSTNLSAVNTNSSASNNVVTLTKFADFELDILFKPSNNVSNALALRWSTSMDGVYWPERSAGTNDQISSWFAISGANVTNSAGWVYWHTNITANANYWRLEWITNGAASSLSNVVVRAWKKPNLRGSASN